MIDNDIVLAQKIVGNSSSNLKNTMFHATSAIYKSSNEKMDLYYDYFKNRSNLLSVIASSDQILNAILAGAKNIDAFDISAFPKYYLYLKLAGIMVLDRDDYLDFFYDVCSDSEKYDDLYFDLIRHNLADDSKRFWDSLINFFDWNDIYNSTLFSSEPVSISDVISQNKYLSKNSYQQLKKVISSVNINTYQGNILDIIDLLEKSYDIAYFSNIIYYVSKMRYKDKMEEVKLNNNGIILTYLYNTKDDSVRDFFNEKNYHIDSFTDSDAGVLVFTR